MIAIIDYDAGNLRSVEKALISLGEAPVITRDGENILDADKVILPGVGSFGDAMGRLPDCPGLKIPHMGWNSLDIKPRSRLFKGIGNGAYVYFVHSYYLKAGEEDIVAASTEYSTHIHAAVERDNVFACQFHPEKSSQVGLAILKNFIEL